MGLSVGTDGLLASLFGVFAKIKTDLKFNEEIRKEYRRKISVRSSEWIGMLDQVAEKIAVKSGGKRPIIYTFPIGLSYDKRFSAMESCFETKTLPMIKIEKIERYREVEEFYKKVYT